MPGPLRLNSEQSTLDQPLDMTPPAAAQPFAEVIEKPVPLQALRPLQEFAPPLQALWPLQALAPTQ